VTTPVRGDQASERTFGGRPALIGHRRGPERISPATTCAVPVPVSRGVRVGGTTFNSEGDTAAILWGRPLIPDHLFTTASRLRITVDETTEPVSLVLVGELDSDEAPKLSDAVAQTLLRNPGRPVGLDTAAVEFLDSGGIRGLIECRQQAENAGCRLTITAVNTVVHQVLEITSLLTIFEAPRPQDGRDPG
jgi:anti-anti-sigma factor